MAKYRPLGPNEICAAIEIYEGGASIEQAARAIGVGYGRLQRAFARHPDFTPRSRKHWRALYPERWKYPPSVQRIPGPYVAAVLRHARSDEAVIQRYAEAADRLHAMRAQVRLGGPILCGTLQVAAAHAAGLTLDDIHEVFAVPPAEAARAIALHAGR